MTDPATLLRSIRIALENTRDGDAFRAEVKRLIAEHDTPSLFDFAAQNARAQARATVSAWITRAPAREPLLLRSPEDPGAWTLLLPAGCNVHTQTMNEPDQ